MSSLSLSILSELIWWQLVYIAIKDHLMNSFPAIPSIIILKCLHIYSWFHITGSWSVHSFNGDYLSILESTGIWTDFNCKLIIYLTCDMLISCINRMNQENRIIIENLNKKQKWWSIGARPSLFRVMRNLLLIRDKSLIILTRIFSKMYRTVLHHFLK